MNKNSIAFLDTNNTANEDIKIEGGVYRKATHPHSPAQSKREPGMNIYLKITIPRNKGETSPRDSNFHFAMFY